LSLKQRDFVQTKIKTLNICLNFIEVNKYLRPKIIDKNINFTEVFITVKLAIVKCYRYRYRAVPQSKNLN